MSNGIGHVWAVNAEGGDEGRPNGVGPVWIENADQLGSKLPEPEAGDAGKVLGVLNADGDLGWVVDQGGMAQVQSDWDQADPSQVSYIANKPNLATVATSGAYSDLSGTPTIPTVDQVYDATSANAQSGVAVASALSGKQDTISDLETIRSGASAGATAVQPAALNDYATTSALTTGLASKQDTISDLETIRSGAEAGSTAVQPGDLATVATSGSYNDLQDKPTIPAAQVNADWDAASGVAQILNKPSLATVATSGSYSDLSNTPNLALKEDVSNKSQTVDATSTTQYPSSAGVAQYVSSAVATATATFLGNFTLTELGLTYPATEQQITAALASHTWPAGTTVDNNDYVYVEIQNPQTTGVDDSVQRYKYNGTAWAYEYTLNNSSFTSGEVDALESGINATKVGNYDAHIADTTIHVTSSDKSTWNGKQDAISDLETIRTGAGLGATAVQPGDLATVAISGSYTDLSNKPSIPAAQVNSDWNAVSGVEQILNKPNLATVATTGAYSDLSGTPTINNVPAVTSSDDDKVLKATYSGGVGSYSWEQAPSSVNIHTITISSYDWEPLHPRSMIFQVDGWFDEDWMGGGYTFEASRSFPRQGYTYNGGYDTETWTLNTLDATNGIYELVYEGNARDWNGMSSDGWTSLQSLASNNGGIVQAKILSIDLTDVTSFSGTPLGTSWVAYGNWYFFNTGSITNMSYALDGVNNIAPVNPSSASTLYPLDLHSCTDLSYAFMGNLSHSTFTGDIPEIIIPTTGNVDVSSAFYGQTGFTGGITACYNRWSSNTDIISHSNCFSYCGSGNVAGQAELATIPQSWGGTAN